MTDLEFARECCTGKAQAWQEFVKKYSRLIHSYVYSVLNQRNPNLAIQENISDIFQEIFVLLSKDNYQKLKSYKAKNGCTLASWLRMVTINYTIDYLRKTRLMVSLDQENEDGLVLREVLEDGSLSVLDRLGKQDKLESLYDCIKSLDVDDRYFLEFYIVRGLSLEAIRNTLEVSRGTVDMQKSRIVSRLKDCFRNKGFPLDLPDLHVNYIRGDDARKSGKINQTNISKV